MNPVKYPKATAFLQQSSMSLDEALAYFEKLEDREVEKCQQVADSS